MSEPISSNSSVAAVVSPHVAGLLVFPIVYHLFGVTGENFLDFSVILYSLLVIVLGYTLRDFSLDSAVASEDTGAEHARLELEGTASGDTDPDVFARVIDESRVTLQNQIEFSDELDDKAMRTTRTSVLLLGIVISALGVAQTNPLDNLPLETLGIAAIGMVFLFASALLGTGTYAVTDVPFGIGSNYRKDALTGNYSEKEWLVELLRGYNRWSRDIRLQNAHNTAYLSRVQILLVLGMSCLVIAAGMTVLGFKFGIHPVPSLLFLVVTGSDAVRLLTHDLP